MGLVRDTTPRLRGRGNQRRRELWLTLHPLCVHCKRQGRITAAREVDHVIALCNGGPDDETNLQSLCIACHKVKTLQDLGIKPEIGVDGWPIG